MNVLRSFEVAPVVSSARVPELFFDKADRYVEEYVQVRHREIEIAVFRIEYPFSKSLCFSFILYFCTLIGDVGIYIPVKQDMTS